MNMHVKKRVGGWVFTYFILLYNTCVVPAFGLNPTVFKNGVSFVLHSSYLQEKQYYDHCYNMLSNSQ